MKQFSKLYENYEYLLDEVKEAITPTMESFIPNKWGDWNIKMHSNWTVPDDVVMFFLRLGEKNGKHVDLDELFYATVFINFQRTRVIRDSVFEMIESMDHFEKVAVEEMTDGYNYTCKLKKHITRPDSVGLMDQKIRNEE